MKSADQGTSGLSIKCNLGLQSDTGSLKRDTFLAKPEAIQWGKEETGSETEAEAEARHMPALPALILLLYSSSFAIVQLLNCV